MISFLLETALKATVLLALAPIIAFATRRRSSAATRHHLYLLALGSALLLPVASATLHPYQTTMPIPPLSAARPAFLFPAPAALPAPITPLTSDKAMPAQPTESQISSRPAAPISGSAVVMIVYLAGVAAVLARLATSFVGLRRLATLCVPLGSESPLRGETDAALHTLGIRRRVALMVAAPGIDSATIATPMTWGIFRPVIALPADAAEWPVGRLRAALLHEAAHLRRNDFLAQSVLARVVIALYWFHPLAWFAARQLRVESECACDDQVLTAGQMLGTDYARHLLEVARAARRIGSASPAFAVTMAQNSTVEQRLRAILNPRRNRRETQNSLRVATLAIAAGAIGSASLLRLVAATAVAAVDASSATIHLANGATIRLLAVDDPTQPDSAWWDMQGKRIPHNPIVQTMSSITDVTQLDCDSGLGAVCFEFL